MSRRKNRKSQSASRARYYAIVGVVAVGAIVGYLLVSGVLSGGGATQSSTTSKPTILYVNQGNGVVNESNFARLLNAAISHGFNTIFFQVYRSGTLLFANSSLNQFVSSAHGQGLKIYFALYFTNSNQEIPASIYNLKEDGINLDMSTLPLAAQTALLGNLSSSYSGKTAITTTNPALPLHPNLLIVETYGPGSAHYIHRGIIASVGVFTTSSRQDYLSQFQYALSNSDGVMVFDYAGLVKAGY